MNCVTFFCPLMFFDANFSLGVTAAFKYWLQRKMQLPRLQRFVLPARLQMFVSRHECVSRRSALTATTGENVSVTSLRGDCLRSLHLRNNELPLNCAYFRKLRDTSTNGRIYRLSKLVGTFNLALWVHAKRSLTSEAFKVYFNYITLINSYCLKHRSNQMRRTGLILLLAKRIPPNIVIVIRFQFRPLQEIFA